MYYVYAYLDPRNLGQYDYGYCSFEYEPFYIGKGKGDRCDSHLYEARVTNYNNHKLNKIRSILNSGLEPIILKVQTGLSELDAFSLGENIMGDLLEKLLDIMEIKVEPGKPEPKPIDYLDSIADQIEIEVKTDGMRGVLLKDPQDKVIRMLSSSGSPYGGNFLNIIKELKEALDDGFCFSGEINDSRDLENRGAANSVARNMTHPATAPIYTVWNAFKITEEMIKKGVITPDAKTELPPYKIMRLDLLRILRKARPRQVKASKRMKITKDMSPSRILAMVLASGEEGVVAKLKTGYISYKHKPFFGPVQIYPIKRFIKSDSAKNAGKYSSIEATTPFGKVFSVGQGYSDVRVNAITKLAAEKGEYPTETIYVGFSSFKPGLPLERGGAPTNPVFQFISTDAAGENRIVEGNMSKATNILALIDEQAASEILDKDQIKQNIEAIGGKSVPGLGADEQGEFFVMVKKADEVKLAKLLLKFGTKKDEISIWKSSLISWQLQLLEVE